MTSTEPNVAAIEKTLELSVPPDRVWVALTDPEALASWFPDRVDDLEPTPGSEGWLAWDEHGRYAITVEACEPPTRLVWSWARKPETALPDGATTRVEWRLEPTDSGGTRLHLRESGFLTESGRRENDRGWDQELEELIDYLEA